MISLEKDDLEATRTFKIKTDVLVDQGIEKAASIVEMDVPEWKPIFWPKDNASDHGDFTLESNMLSTEDMERLGKRATRFRQRLRDAALIAHESELTRTN